MIFANTNVAFLFLFFSRLSFIFHLMHPKSN